MTRRFLVAVYDVTGLNENQISNLCMHAEAQAEASDTAWAGEGLEEYPSLLCRVSEQALGDGVTVVLGCDDLPQLEPTTTFDLVDDKHGVR